MDESCLQLNNANSDVALVYPNEASSSKNKRLKCHTKSVTGSSSLNICIICNKHQHKQYKDTFRIREVSRAKLFLEHEVYTRTSTLESIEDVFAADIMS